MVRNLFLHFYNFNWWNVPIFQGSLKTISDPKTKKAHTQTPNASNRSRMNPFVLHFTMFLREEIIFHQIKPKRNFENTQKMGKKEKKNVKKDIKYNLK